MIGHLSSTLLCQGHPHSLQDSSSVFAKKIDIKPSFFIFPAIFFSGFISSVFCFVLHCRNQDGFVKGLCDSITTVNSISMAGIRYIIQLNDPIAIPIITQSPLNFKKLLCSSNRQNRCRPFPRDKWLSKSFSDQTALNWRLIKSNHPAWYIWNRRKSSLHQGKIPSKKGEIPGPQWEWEPVARVARLFQEFWCLKRLLCCCAWFKNAAAASHCKS